jgi:hypothetical protein
VDYQHPSSSPAATQERRAATQERSEPLCGAPQPRGGRSLRQTLSAVGIAAVIAGFGGAAIYAATSGGSNNAGPGMHGPGPGGMGGHPGMGPPAPLHGEFVVPGGNVGYTTELTQTGTLTAVSDGSMTARSTDGFSQTYVIAPDGTANSQLAVNDLAVNDLAVNDLAVNDTVTIRATLVNGTATVTTVAQADDAGPGAPPSAPPGPSPALGPPPAFNRPPHRPTGN